jgi:CDP-diacylglycerol---serine O-phosphatidyltransferase
MQVTRPYVDQSRDRAVEDPTNLWLIHPAARALLPWAVKRGISANAVSIAGLGMGAFAGLCFTAAADWRFASLGFILCIGWLVADGLDGMVARATGTASPTGRILDGLCDHGVFGFIYVALAIAIGTIDAWLLGSVAAAVHAVQASLYEGERARYHRRLRGDPVPPPPLPSTNLLVRIHDAVETSLDRAAASFDRHLATSPNRAQAIEHYRRIAIHPMKTLALLSANVRVIAIYVACLAGDPSLFWWFEIIPLSAVALAGILWHRAAERLSARTSGV